MSAHDDGDVCVWYTRDLSRIALRLSVSVSAWGVALHKEKRLLAVSANSHNITVFQLGIGEDEQRAKKSREEDEENYFEGGRQFERKKRRRGHEAPMDSGVRTYANVAASGLDGGRRRAPATPSPPTQENISSPYKRMVKTLKGHETNIPSISFLDDPSGRWLVSTSIDGVVVVWDIEAEKMVEKTKLGHLEYTTQKLQYPKATR